MAATNEPVSPLILLGRVADVGKQDQTAWAERGLRANAWLTAKAIASP
jgi:hypothetical protein